MLPGFVLMGAGIGVTNPALASTALAVVPPGSVLALALVRGRDFAAAAA